MIGQQIGRQPGGSQITRGRFALLNPLLQLALVLPNFGTLAADHCLIDLFQFGRSERGRVKQQFLYVNGFCTRHGEWTSLELLIVEMGSCFTSEKPTSLSLLTAQHQSPRAAARGMESG